MAHHTDDGLLVEETNCGGSEFGEVDEGIGIRILVDHRVGNVVGAFG